MHEFAHRVMRRLMPQYQLTRKTDWASVFIKYDGNSSGILSKSEFRQMIKDSGMERVTESEANYIYDVINKNSRKSGINMATFKNWGRSIQSKPQ